MKRIISVLAVMAIMAAMVAASALPAFAGGGRCAGNIYSTDQPTCNGKGFSGR